METTYRAVEAYEPGKIRLVQRQISEPGLGQVRIRVEACGVCHTDSLTVGGFPTPETAVWPRVPGHEVIGRIEAAGEDVTRWPIGKRVGVGFFGGECNHCEPCRRGDLINCQNAVFTGLTVDGGWAEVVIANEKGLASVPDEISPEEAGPLLCAGVTTFNALRNAALRGGDLVGIQGVGGLGHLGIQYARKMGFEVAAIGVGADNRELSFKLGAHHFIDAAESNAVEELKKLGSVRAILATAPKSASHGPLLGALAPGGKLIVAGTDGGNVSARSFDLLIGKRSINGTLTGTSIDEEDALAFSALADVHPMVEVMPLEMFAEAYDRMMKAKARFRVVFTMQ